jgi:hypothetical protein
VPMSGGRTIPVIADEYVDMEFGTGALKITPGEITRRRCARRGGGVGWGVQMQQGGGQDPCEYVPQR